MKIGIVGAGLQCRRRIEAIIDSKEDQVVLVAGLNQESLDLISSKYHLATTLEPDTLFTNSQIEAIIVCTPPSSHLYYMTLALKNKKKTLVEKPISQTSQDLIALQNEFGSAVDTYIRCGFNHRFHPAIKQMKSLLNKGAIGNLIFARAIYGICARDDYFKEWRANPKFAAGGQFIEQGSHLIDLFNWMIGIPTGIYCRTTNLIFRNQPLEDGGMAILSYARGITAQMHTTLGQWHNRFEFEIFGDLGFLRVEGLGNTYGTEKLVFGKRNSFAPFSQEVIEFRGSDKSWRDEWESFKLSFEVSGQDIGNFKDGLLAMQIAEAGYKSNQTSTEVLI